MTQQAGAGQPKYMAIASDLREKIANGTYALGSKLPPVHELGDEYRAAPNTIRSAVTLLVQEGLAQSYQGDGVYVRKVPGPDEPSPAYAAVMQALGDMQETVRLLSARVDGMEKLIGSRNEGS